VPLEWGHAQWCEVGSRCDQDLAPVKWLRTVTLCGVNYELEIPYCSLRFQPTERDMADWVGAYFGIDVGTKDDVERLWEKSFLKTIPVRGHWITHQAVQGMSLFMEGHFGRSYHDMSLVKFLAERLPLVQCFECGSITSKDKYWCGGWGYRQTYCSQSCERKADRKWAELKRARQQLRKTRRLLRKPSEVAQLRQSREEASPTAATPRS